MNRKETSTSKVKLRNIIGANSGILDNACAARNHKVFVDQTEIAIQIIWNALLYMLLRESTMDMLEIPNDCLCGEERVFALEPTWR